MNKLILKVCVILATMTQAHAATLSIMVKDSTGKPLADTVVYLHAASPASPSPGTEIRIEQKGKEFRPFVSVTPVGTTAMFPNQDGIGHHVYSFSPTKTFELPLSEAESSESVVFDKTGMVTVGCNIHDWMVGYIYVVDTPWHGVSSETGQLLINNVPAGNYTIHVSHPGMKTGAMLEQPLQISGTEPIQKEFSLDIRPEYFWKPPRPPELEEEEY